MKLKIKGRKLFKSAVVYILTACMLLAGLPTAFAEDTVKAKSVKIDTIEILENTNGYSDLEYNLDTDLYDLEFYRYSYAYDVNFTVTMPDGTVLQSEDGAVEYNGEYYYLEITDDQSYENQWKIGSHTASASIMGLTVSFNIDILESPIESIDMEDYSLLENTKGSAVMDYNHETGEYDLEYYKYYYDSFLNYTVNLKNGSILESVDGVITYNGEDYSLKIDDGQCYNNPWGVGEHRVRAELMGYAVEFTVTVLESPISEIIVDPVEIIEGTSGNMAADYLPETGEYTDKYFKYSFMPEVLVVLKDSTVLESEDGYIGYNGDMYYIGISDDQSFGNQWKSGTHKANLEVMGVATQFDVVISDTPVKSAELENVKIIKNTSGYIDAEYNPDTDEYDLEYFRYAYIPEYKLTLKDGTVLESSAGVVEYEGKTYSINISDDQGFGNEWQTGVHMATAEIMGFKSSFNVEIAASPVKKITVGNLELIQNTNGETDYDYNFVSGEYDLEYFRYIYSHKLNVTVEMTDGSILSGEDSIEYNGEEYYLVIEDGQSYEDRWDIGSHSVRAELMGVSTQFNVDIVESPVDFIEVGDVEIIENTSGHIETVFNPVSGKFDFEYFRYTYSPYVRLNMKDGSTKVCNGDIIEYDGEIYYLNIKDGQSFSNRWGVGSHEVTAEILGASASFNVLITESPIKSISVEPLEIIQFTEGSKEYDENPETGEYDLEYFKYFYTYELSFTVTLTDGTILQSEDGVIRYDGEYYHLNITDDQSFETAWGIGKHTASAELMGVKANVEVNIVENPISKVTVNRIVIKKNTNGSTIPDFNPLTGKYDLLYYKYYYDNMIEYTVKLKDGTTLKSRDGAIVYDGQEYNLNVNDTQSYNSKWGVGTHKVTAELMGISTSFNVVISNYELGDVNCNGTVDIRDATLIQKKLASFATLTGDQTVLADVDGNYSLNINDVTALQKLIARVIV